MLAGWFKAKGNGDTRLSTQAPAWPPERVPIGERNKGKPEPANANQAAAAENRERATKEREPANRTEQPNPKAKPTNKTKQKDSYIRGPPE